MIPPRIDTHTHTVHCGHAHPDMTVANAVAAADAAGLEAYYITEHLHEPAHLARLEAIGRDLAAVHHACRVLLGGEVDADPVAADGSLMAPVDGLAYVIASTHHYPGSRRVWNGKFEFDAEEKQRLIDAYFAWAARIVINPVVQTWAHPAVILAQNTLTPDYAAMLERFRPVFAAAAEAGCWIELNELAARKMTPAHRATYPAVIRLAAEQGCSFVFASDAHRPEDVWRFEWTVHLAREAGLRQEQIVFPGA